MGTRAPSRRTALNKVEATSRLRVSPNSYGRDAPPDSTPVASSRVSCRPKLLLVEEPSQGLAPVVIDRVYGGLRTAADTGVAVLVAEQFQQLRHGASDRVFAIRNGGEIHGWIGRRSPAHDGDESGRAVPKYLNTAQTDLFTKGHELYGLTEGASALTAGAVLAYLSFSTYREQT